MRNTYWNVVPRYSAGSPAAIRDKRTVQLVIDSERRCYQAALEGLYGPEQQRRAERLGLRGIVSLTRERGRQWLVYDELTEEHYVRPFDERMRKDGYVRFHELEPLVQDAVDPVVAAEARRDTRPYWFRVPALSELWRGGQFTVPADLLWEPTITQEPPR